MSVSRDQELRDLAAAYMRHFRHCPVEPDDKWSSIEVDGLVKEAPLEALALARYFAELEASPDELAFLGAGVLEDLLGQHGSSIVGPLLTEADRNPSIYQALKAVWRTKAMSEALWAQLNAYMVGRESVSRAKP